MMPNPLHLVVASAYSPAVRDAIEVVQAIIEEEIKTMAARIAAGDAAVEGRADALIGAACHRVAEAFDAAIKLQLDEETKGTA